MASMGPRSTGALADGVSLGTAEPALLSVALVPGMSMICTALAPVAQACHACMEGWGLVVNQWQKHRFLASYEGGEAT